MKKFVITMTLILIGQVALSQIVITDTQGKTVILDREAAIDKARIIENEKALYEENLVLKEYIKTLEASNANLEKQVSKLEKDIVSNKDELIGVQKEIIKGYEENQKITDKASDYGFYLNSGYGFNDIGFSVGGSYVAKKMTYTVIYNPTMKAVDGSDFPALQLVVGLKLF